MRWGYCNDVARRLNHPSCWSLLLLALDGCYVGRDASSPSGDGQGADDAGGSGSPMSGSGSGDDGGGVAQCADGPSPGLSPIRRLTRFEYDATIEHLLGDSTHPAAAFPQEGGSGFDNNANVISVSPLHAEKYMDAAEGIAARATEDLASLLPCDPAAVDDACIGDWLEEFGEKAWRRPLDAVERAELLAFYQDAREKYDVREAVSLVLQTMLQSPNFLYRVEFGLPSAGANVVQLTDWEMATRLSYLLWGSMPDDELFAAARAGELAEPAQIEAQARRMLEQPRARAMLLHFHEQWLDYGEIDQVSKDAELFPDFGPDIAAAQRAEIDAFIEHVVFEGDGTVESLLTAPYTFVDDALADFYGLPLPGGVGLQRVTPTDRAVSGVLTKGAVMSVQAKPHETHPIARGVFVREQLLCTIPPPPPEGVEIVPPAVDPNATTRDRYEQHRNDPTCAGCHHLFDPLGFALENYDATGRWRLLENGLDIDASGELTATDVNGAFVGPAELGARLATSQMVHDCITTQWFRYGYGRTESPDVDACSLAQLRQRFADGGFDIKELLVALTQTDAFLYRPAVEGQ